MNRRSFFNKVAIVAASAIGAVALRKQQPAAAQGWIHGEPIPGELLTQQAILEEAQAFVYSAGYNNAEAKTILTMALADAGMVHHRAAAADALSLHYYGGRSLQRINAKPRPQE